LDPGLAQLLKNLPQVVTLNAPIRGQIFPQGGGHAIGHPFDAKRLPNRIGNNVDEGGVDFLRLMKETRVAGLQMEQSGLHMLARPQVVGAKVHTGTGKQSSGKTPYFHVIGHSAVGADAEIGEDRMPAIQPDYMERFSLRAPSPFVEFVNVCRTPVMGMGKGDFKTPCGRGRVNGSHKPLYTLRLKSVNF
jgi:hypothetical protein